MSNAESQKNYEKKIAFEIQITCRKKNFFFWSSLRCAFIRQLRSSNCDQSDDDDDDDDAEVKVSHLLVCSCDDASYYGNLKFSFMVTKIDCI